MEKEKIGLYIHIPFCSKKCDYCDFISYSTDVTAQKAYLDHLEIEMQIMRKKLMDKTIDSIYIGGGTPSFVFDGFIISLMHNVYSNFDVAEGAEITIEINPNSITEQKLIEYHLSGINRLSMGIQCLDEEVLRKVGRIQTLENVKEAFRVIKRARYDNVSVDLMIGLPGQTKKMVDETIKYVVKQNVRHISLYALQVEKGTLLYRRVNDDNTEERQKESLTINDNIRHTAVDSLQQESRGLLFDSINSGKVKPLSDDECVKLYDFARKKLEKYKYHRYEVSNFARIGYESRHNLKYWNRSKYIGLGVSAHSYFGGYRYSNTNRLDTYIQKLDNKELPIATREYIDINTARTEAIMLGLRTVQGLDLAKFRKDFDEDLERTYKTTISRLSQLGMVKVEEGYLKITDEYFYVANKIIEEFVI
ncbi:MAG: coproporphyrinogen-III oxidase family protein [Clostridia bacterium]